MYGCFQKKGYPPKSSILIGFSIINHPFWVIYPYIWKHPYVPLPEKKHLLVQNSSESFLSSVVGQHPTIYPKGVCLHPKTVVETTGFLKHHQEDPALKVGFLRVARASDDVFVYS